MPRLALYLLGPPRLERDADSVQVKRRKVIALLAYLAVTRQPHSREALVTLLSPEFDTGRARNELRRTLSVLNRLLGARCLTADPSPGSAQPPERSEQTEQGLRLDSVDRLSSIR